MAKSASGIRAAWLPAIMCAVLFHISAFAAPLAKQDVPDPLRPWTEWVLHDTPQHVCPYFYNNGETRQCTWPAAINLVLDKHGGTFQQQIQVFRPLWAALPGDADHWPQDVRIDGKPATITARENIPGITLPVGSHQISGMFAWDELPESLQLPEETALVALRLNGHDVFAPKLDGDGHLWMQSQTADKDAGAERLEVRVGRLLSDDIPFMMTTRLELTVSGKNREVLIPAVLLPGFVPVSLSSQLPTRLEPDGKVRIQVRPGRWELSVAARQMTAPAALTLPAGAQSLADEEIWVFQAHNELRVVNPQGATPIDPKQTSLPADWKRLPAFRIRPGETLKLIESKRGDPQPAPDQLSLQRNIWLDFDGRGYTMQDRITGTLSRSWRFEMLAPGVLGRAAIDNEDQFITRLGNASGIEVRHGQANIVADSRIDSDARSFSATGWKQDFQQVSAQLNLPPGWRLFAAGGTDKTPGSWVAQWTLLDFFVVLMIALACGNLWGWRWGAVALAALVVSYHEPDAPRWIWLAVLAGAALLKVLPLDGRIRRLVGIYRAMALLGLVLIVLPFAVMQIRQAIYPVLEPVMYANAMPLHAAPEEEPAVAAAPAAAMPAEVKMLAKPDAPPSPAKEIARLKSKVDNPYTLWGSASLNQIDPNAIVQTGPGLPQWQWRRYELQWNGPVEQAQQLTLWLLSPAMNVLLSLLRVTLLAVLFVRLLDRPLNWPPTWPRLPRYRHSATAASLLAFVLAMSLAAPHGAWASDLPNAEMLGQLKERLLQPAECLPDCADIARMQIDAKGASLQIRLEAHALENTAIPLPGGAKQWLPQTVSVDGKSAGGLMRDGDGRIWLPLTPGVHQILMQGDIGQSENVQMSLPLKPRRVEAHTDGWTIAGIHDNGVADDNLQLTRTQQAAGGKAAMQEANLPPFVRVERTLILGLRWQVHTRVQRVAPANAPIFVAVPLLPGESITSNEPRVENGVAQVNLSPQADETSWDSALKEQPVIALKAATQTNLIEVWRLDAGTQWHVDLAGIPVIHHQSSDLHWMPEWQPWPGEAVTLNISKPAGVAGQTLTLDSSELIVTPGIRASTVTLHLDLRGSRGGLHTVRLPEEAVLQSVNINQQSMPIRLEERELHLPLQPGKQLVAIEWRQPGGISTWFKTPDVDTGIAGVNAGVQFRMPQDRWTLLLGGPRMGPAILLWGVILVIALAAFGLARFQATPLKGRHWFLLGLGLTQAPPMQCVLIVGWLLALGGRKQYGAGLSDGWFRAGQVVLALWTLVALASLFVAVEQSLIGYPEMQIVGNNSSSLFLSWYQDRSTSLLPQPWVISLPLLAYRLLMLLWALWLAYALIKWLKWGWSCFSEAGYWRSSAKVEEAPQTEAPSSEVGAE